MHISCKSLSKKYGNRLAVKSVSLEIIPGKILALLGPNGAGKSTTIKMLTGQTKPNGGEIIIDSKSYKSFPTKFRDILGIMPQEIIIWENLNILENLEYTASLYRLDKSNYKEKIKQMISELKLEPELKTLAKNLSGGYKRRLNLAISILHNPSVIFLDEPTPGIDAQSRILLTEYIQNLAKTGKYSIVLTDHYLDEAEKLADYVVIIDNGEVVTEGTVSQLKSKHGTGNLLQVHLDPEKKYAEDEVKTEFEKYFEVVRLAKDTINIPVKDTLKSLGKAMEIVNNNSYNALNINIKEPTLEDIFLLITGKDVRE